MQNENWRGVQILVDEVAVILPATRCFSLYAFYPAERRCSQQVDLHAGNLVTYSIFANYQKENEIYMSEYMTRP